MQLMHCDVMDYLDMLFEANIFHNAIFADPPDNLGLEYAEFTDDLKPAHYYLWLDDVIQRALPRCRVFWLSYYHGHDLEVKWMIRQILRFNHPSWQWKQFLWTFTFSQYTDKDCSVAHRPIIRLSRPDWKADTEHVRVPSARMELGDARASGPRVPSTTLDFPRVVGNARERRSWHPTQHPEALMEFIMRLSGPGSFCDLFVGSGTTFRVAKKIGKEDVVGVELSKTYCEHLQNEHILIREHL